MASKYNIKDTYYFSHDSNARNDPKIAALRSVYGVEGYGVYFMLLEIFREQPEYKYPVTKYMCNALAMQMQIDAELLHNIIDDCCNEFVDGGEPLLINDGEFLYSESFLKRMGKVEELSERNKRAAEKRWRDSKDSENQAEKAKNQAENAENDASAMQTQCECNAKDEKCNANKVKESKVKESKINKTKVNSNRKESIKEKIFSDFASGDTDLLEALQDFEKMRNKIKKPMTDTAKQRLLAKLESITKDPERQIEMLREAEEHCWLTVYEHDRPAAQQSGNSGRLSSGAKMDVLTEIYEGVEG